MSYFQQWESLIQHQTQSTFRSFWETYSSTEQKIYSDLLDHPEQHFQGTFSDLVEQYQVDPVIFTGFLDGIQESLRDGKLDLTQVDDDTEIDFDVDLEKLYFNMLKADAEYLYQLPQWDAILGAEKKDEITSDYKKSRTVVKGEKIGRNDPCPCGSGKKYKYCCGRNA